MTSPRRPRWDIAFLALAVAACDTSEVVPNAVQPDRSVDETAIRARIAENEAAANRLDAVGVAATFTASADIMVLSGPRIAGREAIESAISSSYAARPPLEIRIEVGQIRFLSTDVAIAETAGVHRYADGDSPDRASFVMVRQEGEWLISAVRVLEPESEN